MASTTTTLTNTYQLIADGSVTIQKTTRGFGGVMIFAGTSAPSDDTNSMYIETNDPHYFETTDSLYARTPHSVTVDIVTMV